MEQSVETKPVRPGKTPGNSKGRKGRHYPKGRQVDPTAAAEIKQLLGDRQRSRDLLIEFLHLVQDKYNYISAAHIAALAEELRLSQAEVFEVASFYHHFDIVREGETPPPETTIRVCNSLSCQMAGSEEVIRQLEQQSPDNVRIQKVACIGLCNHAPAACLNQNHHGCIRANQLLNEAAEHETSAEHPYYQSMNAYESEGGYETLKSLRAGKYTPDEVADLLLESGLKGLGGAGFPAGQKWKFVRTGEAPRYLCINADEGEPGTFKDRYYLQSHPHQFLEGVLIAAWAIEAEKTYIYLRNEYPAIRSLLTEEISLLEAEELIKPGYIELRRGAGAYICGEESAMIESIEGKRGIPRHRPPYVASVGLFGRPTLVHNVETVYWMPKIIMKGAKWFAGLGRDGHKGNRSYSVSGRVNKPQVVVTAAGATVSELIEACGGMLDGHKFKAYLPGGPSGGILPASLDNLPLDFGTLAEYGCFVGSHAVIILSDRDDMKSVATNLLEFFMDESCGQCTPCRVGCKKAVDLIKADKWDISLLEELAATMADASICGLGQAAPNPIKSVIRFFRGEVA